MMDPRAFVRWAGALGWAAVLATVICSLLLQGNRELQAFAVPPQQLLTGLPSPILFQGNRTTAYRDPAAAYHDGWFYLFFTLTKIEPTNEVFEYTAWSKSRDLVQWTKPKIFTPRNSSLNYSSPGNIIRFAGKWVLCLQTYPRPHGEKYGDKHARIWIMRSDDLEHWGPPELLHVKGPDVPVKNMGRMIDPFLLQDKDDPGKWWVFYKQKGMSRSWSRDLEHWTFAGATSAGENTCILVTGNEYVLFDSPENGIEERRSTNLSHWRKVAFITLGQRQWPWARGRLTAGFVLDARQLPGVGKYLMFFHGSPYAEDDPRGGFDNLASIGLAWSNDLQEWHWPGEKDSNKR